MAHKMWLFEIVFVLIFLCLFHCLLSEWKWLFCLLKLNNKKKCRSKNNGNRNTMKLLSGEYTMKITNINQYEYLPSSVSVDRWFLHSVRCSDFFYMTNVWVRKHSHIGSVFFFSRHIVSTEIVMLIECLRNGCVSSRSGCGFTDILAKEF